MKRTAADLLALPTIAGSAQAYTVSAKVCPLIKEALALAQAHNCKAAMAKVNEAEAVKAWPDDETVINQLRQYIVVSSDPTHFHCTTRDGMGVTRCDGRAIGVRP